MKHPHARHQLIRMHEMVGASSICRVVEDRGLLQSELVSRAAATDRSADEEIVALARERGWALEEPKPYEWQLMAAHSDPRPRIMRILQRDLFELDGMTRGSDDEDVAALAAQLRSDRRGLIRDLMHEQPSLSLPGAK